MKDQDRPAIGTMTVGRAIPLAGEACARSASGAHPLTRRARISGARLYVAPRPKRAPIYAGCGSFGSTGVIPLVTKIRQFLLERVLCDPGTIKDHTCKSEPLTTAGALNR
jgi:hypothetical protein